MISLFKILTLALLFLLSACSAPVHHCTPEEQAPFYNKLAQLRAEYQDTHLLAAGLDKKREIAKQKARQELAAQITSNVVSQTNIFVSEFMQEIQAEVQEATLSVGTDVGLIGAEIKYERQNSCQQHQFVLALPRSNVKDILERAKKESLNKRQTTTSLSLKLEYTSHKGGKFVSFQDGDTLHSGDLYKMIFESSEDVYVYIFQFDSANQIYRLFPKGSFAGEDPNNTNPVRKNRKYFIPGPQKSFELDNQIGKETIHIVASNKPEPLLEKQYQQFVAMQERSNNTRNIQNARQELEKAFAWRERRGIQSELVHQNPSDSGSFKPIELCDGCVYSLDFEHQSR